MTTIFDSRDTRYKTPYGAAPCGTAVTVTLRPPQEFSSGALLLFEEFADAYWEQPLTPAGGEDGREIGRASCRERVY